MWYAIRMPTGLDQAPRRADVKSISFKVLGVPTPKGSSRAMMRGGNAVNVPSGSNANRDALQSWGNAVRCAAAEAVQAVHGREPGVFFSEVPLRIMVVFRMRRLKSHFNKKTGQVRPDAPKWHTVKPDFDKLLRSTMDNLTGIVVLDDSNFAESLSRKVYADPGKEGAWISIEELT